MGDARTLLLVEDDHGIWPFMVRMLTEQGYTVRHAASVAEAVQGPAPDIIVADYGLPDGPGTMVGAAFPGVPVIIMSGRDAPSSYDGPWIVKPFGMRQLVDALNVLR